jgi:hypothetical protein
MDLNSEKVDALAICLEEATRASDQLIKRFVEPAQGTLGRATSRRHHIVFGRRGSGKSSLLKKVRADLSVLRKPVAYVDMEAFKGHSFPDVLVSVLISTLDDYERWLNAEGTNKKRSWWEKIFGKAPSFPPIDASAKTTVLGEITKLRAQLEKKLHEEDSASVESSNKSVVGARGTEKDSDSIVLGAPPFAVTTGGASESEKTSSSERSEKVVAARKKHDFLQRIIIELQRLFLSISKLGGGGAYLIIDDLYHLRRGDQASVLDYLHRIAKSSQIWLKIGTIRHRTDHYRHGSPPVGMKLGDDADEIDLDLTLEKFSITKSFLSNVLGGLCKETDIATFSDILTDGGVTRLVVASGGVARDFLTILRRSIDIARERLQAGSDRYSRITAEDINRAAGEHESSKRDELRYDSAEESRRLEAALEHVTKFCFEDANTNCLLLDHHAPQAAVDLMAELVDLKMLHLVKSRVTVPKKQGAVYRAYMLDLSQYAGDRTRRNFEVINLWDSDNREALRKVSLVIDPNLLTSA